MAGSATAASLGDALAEELGRGLTGWSALPLVLMAGVAVWETVAPSQRLNGNMTVRWISSAALYITCVLLGIAVADGLSPLREALDGHLLGRLPAVVAYIAGLVLLDFVLYWSHRLHHGLPLLWRFHAVHHSDIDVDLATAVRHHPGEFVVNLGIVTLAAAVLGIPAEVIAGYGAVALSVQILQHANVAVPGALQRWLQLLVVTPDLHRVHHSRSYVEGNKNFGVILTLWDRLFGTYCRLPAGPARFGLDEFDAPRFQWFPWLLVMPALRSGFSAPAARAKVDQ